MIAFDVHILVIKISSIDSGRLPLAEDAAPEDGMELVVQQGTKIFQ